MPHADARAWIPVAFRAIETNNHQLPSIINMKFIYTALLALCVLGFSGCGAKKESLPATQNAPKFESAAANDYVKVYSDYVNEYVTAIKTKDAAKIASLSAKGQEMVTKATTAMKELKGADMQKFQEWAAKVATEMNDAISKAAK